MFEWIRQVDKQRTYTYDLSLVEEPSIPAPTKYVGMEWIRSIDKQESYFNSSMFVAISDIKFSTVYPWANNNSINLSCELIHAQNRRIRYKVIYDDNDLVISNDLQVTPVDLSINIPTQNFGVGENTIILLITDEDGAEVDYEFILVKEDRDTFEFTREFIYLEDYTDRENIYVSNGLGLKEMGAGEVLLEIPTEGKSTIKSITAEDSDEGELIETPLLMDKISADGEGAIYKKKIIPSEWERLIKGMAVK